MHYYDHLQEALCCLREAWVETFDQKEGGLTPRLAIENAMLSLLKVPSLQTHQNIIYEIIVTGLRSDLSTYLLTTLGLMISSESANT